MEYDRAAMRIRWVILTRIAFVTLSPPNCCWPEYQSSGFPSCQGIKAFGLRKSTIRHGFTLGKHSLNRT
jgi:hypothetical protein